MGSIARIWEKPVLLRKCRSLLFPFKIQQMQKNTRTTFRNSKVQGSEQEEWYAHSRESHRNIDRKNVRLMQHSVASHSPHALSETTLSVCCWSCWRLDSVDVELCLCMPLTLFDENISTTNRIQRVKRFRAYGFGLCAFKCVWHRFFVIYFCSSIVAAFPWKCASSTFTATAITVYSRQEELFVCKTVRSDWEQIGVLYLFQWTWQVKLLSLLHADVRRANNKHIYLLIVSPATWLYKYFNSGFFSVTFNATVTNVHRQ